MNNIYILCIETSADLCSVALSANGEEIAISNCTDTKSHAQKILILIEQILNGVNLKLGNLSAIAISAGPGSYTGLRIGYATIKGLCLALDIPLIEINTLFAMASAVILKLPNYDYYIPMLDARRMEVYSMVVNINGEIIEDQKPVILDLQTFNNLQNFKVITFGSGSTKFCPISNHRKSWHNLPDVIPEANYLIKLSYIQYLRNDFGSINSCEPIYLKTLSSPESELITTK